MFSLKNQRRFAILICIGLLSLACRTTQVREHSSADGAPAVSIKPIVKGEKGEKLLVGGLLCQLVLKEGDKRILVASETSSVEKPVEIRNLKPGLYRLSIKGGDIHKITQEFELEANKRLTFQVNLGVARTKKSIDEALEAATPGRTNLIVRYSAGPILYLVELVGIVAIKVLINSLESDDDDDDDDGKDEAYDSAEEAERDRLEVDRQQQIFEFLNPESLPSYQKALKTG